MQLFIDDGYTETKTIPGEEDRPDVTIQFRPLTGRERAIISESQFLLRQAATAAFMNDDDKKAQELLEKQEDLTVKAIIDHVKAWSFERPINEETLACMDGAMGVAIYNEVSRFGKSTAREATEEEVRLLKNSSAA